MNYLVAARAGTNSCHKQTEFPGIHWLFSRRVSVCLLILALFPQAIGAEPRVVTSILPLYEITAAIMQGVSKPELLIKGRASTHHFAFKPSDFRLLGDADLVIWIDRFFESGFQRLPEILPRHAIQLEMLRVKGLESEDGHLWYSPNKLPVMIGSIQRVLSELDPVHHGIYQANAELLIKDIMQWHDLVKITLKSTPPVYLLDHDFLKAFEQDMGIRSLVVLHDSHDRAASISKLQQIEKTILEKKPRCLLINEPSVSKLGQNLARKYHLEIHNLDQFESVDTGHNDFMQRLYRLTDILQKCSST